MSDRLDIESNRHAAKYTSKEQFLRVLWSLAWPLYRFSPRPMFGWRRMLLKMFGARVGREVHIYPSATVVMPWNLEVGDFGAIGEHAYIYNLGRVSLGERATISQRVHICAGTHDHSDAGMALLKPPITIGSQAWICADAFVGPGVRVGDGAVVGARAVVVKDVAPWTIVVGNPALVVKMRVVLK